MARASLVSQAAILALIGPLYHHLGLSFAWETLAPSAVFLALLLGAWAYHHVVPDRRNGDVVTDLLLAVFLLLLLTNIGSPVQYAAVALKRPLVDHWLAAADAALRIDVPSLTAWTRAHPPVRFLLTICYVSLAPQFVLAPVVVTIVLKDRQRLWEYVFHFHFCLFVTLASLALFPAAGAFTHYGFESTLSQARFIHQFQALRDGSFAMIRFDDLEGLISMPSFHAIGGLMVTWMFRGRRRWFVPIALLNVGLVVSTVLTGAHYFVDVVGAGLVFTASLGLFRIYGFRLAPNAASMSTRVRPRERVSSDLSDGFVGTNPVSAAHLEQATER